MNSLCRALALTLCFAACGGDPFAQYRLTLVSRERRVVTRVPALDGYFAAVFGYQQALGKVDLRRAQAYGVFAHALDLSANAEVEALVTAIQARLTAAQVAHVRVRFTTAPNSADRLDAWAAALTTVPAAGHDMAADIDARYQEFVESIGVVLTPDHADASLTTLLADVVTLLRSAEANRRCMERLSGATNPIFAGGADRLSAAPASLRSEFASAEVFVLSVHARAALQTQASARTEGWVLSALSSDAPVEAPAQSDQPFEPVDLDAGAADASAPPD